VFLAGSGKVDAIDEDVVYCEGGLAGDADGSVLAFGEVGMSEVCVAYLKSIDNYLVIAGGLRGLVVVMVGIIG